MCLRYGMHCVCLLHFDAPGGRGLAWCVRSATGGGHPSALDPPPIPQPVTHQVRQAGQQGSRAGSAVGWQGMCSPPVLLHSPRCCPVGGVSGCLGCLENFSETPGHPVCFGLCSTHHTPSAHPHHTTPHHTIRPSPPQCSPPACTLVPCHPCTLARMPGCASARSDVAWSLLRDKASPAVVPWGSPKAAQGTRRFDCVLVKSRKAAPPLPGFVYQVHNSPSTTTSLQFASCFLLTHPDLVLIPFTTPRLLPNHRQPNQFTHTARCISHSLRPNRHHHLATTRL